jgi:hypothetical protein
MRNKIITMMSLCLFTSIGASSSSSRPHNNLEARINQGFATIRSAEELVMSMQKEYQNFDQFQFECKKILEFEMRKDTAFIIKFASHYALYKSAVDNALKQLTQQEPEEESCLVSDVSYASKLLISVIDEYNFYLFQGFRIEPQTKDLEVHKKRFEVMLDAIDGGTRFLNEKINKLVLAQECKNPDYAGLLINYYTPML